MNVVRNIYLFHTQDRGWSDIGYNYLIAPDGTIFKGRDPEAGDQDLVRGAHFCGSNSNTTGICLLGNLSLVNATDEAVNSLTELLNWKTLKDELDPLASSSHPLNSSLRIIAGHRDGCATECPGNNFYPEMSDIRTSTNRKNEFCLNPPDPEPQITEIMIGPNPTRNSLNISAPEGTLITSYELYSLTGNPISFSTQPNDNNGATLRFTEMAEGVYILALQGPSINLIRKILID